MVARSSPLYVPENFGGNSGPYRQRYLPSTGQTGGVLSVTWDFRPIIRLIARISGESQRADGAVRQAHREMADIVGGYAQEVLQDEISHRGERNIAPRLQKDTQRLILALTDPEIADVNSSGFTYGYLNRIKEIDLYWRRIEEGSATQVDQVFYGAFLTGDKFSWPTSNESSQTDLRLIKFKGVGPLTSAGTYKSQAQRAMEGADGPGGTALVRIGKPIQAYHYLAQGYARFLGAEGQYTSGSPYRTTVLSTYARAFAEKDMNFYARWAARFPGVSPTRAGHAVTKGYGSPG